MRPLSKAEGRVHVVESISVEIDVDVVGNLDAAVPHETGENFHVNSFIIAVCRKSMTEDVLAVELHAGFLAEFLGLVGQLLIGVSFLVLLKNPLCFALCHQDLQNGSGFGG